MDYRDWIINGVQPFWVVSMDKSSFPKITLHCAAHYSNEGFDKPIDEIKVFEKLATHSIKNDGTLINGNTDLQISPDGQIFPITNGDETWQGALYYPSYTLDDTSETLIEFDLIFELQIVKVPDYNGVPYNLVNHGYVKYITTVNMETDDLGTFLFDWDGQGHVWICSDYLVTNPETDQITVDDEIIVTNNVNGHSVSASYDTPEKVLPGNCLDITGILTNHNMLNVQIHDIFGVQIGCGSLFIVQI